MEDIIIKHEKLVDGELKYRHLLGKEFKLGSQDCYEMARRMFKDNFNIKLTNYARPDYFWREEDINVYVDNYKNEGFEIVDNSTKDNYRPFDCFLIAIPDPRNPRKTITNHCAIYLKDDYIIHHRYGHTSAVDKYKGTLKNLTTHHLRHKDIPDLRDKTKTKIDLMDIMTSNKKRELQAAREEYENGSR